MKSTEVFERRKKVEKEEERPRTKRRKYGKFMYKTFEIYQPENANYWTIDGTPWAVVSEEVAKRIIDVYWRRMGKWSMQH